MVHLDSKLQSGDITFSTEVGIVKAMLFLVVIYGCESWTIKKAEHWRIDAFELWCWKTLLRVPWTARRSNQSILKEISPGYSLEGLMLKLKLQCFGHLMRRADSLKKTLCVCITCSVVSDSLYSPWNSPGQNTGVGSLSLLQEIFPTQVSNSGLPHCRQVFFFFFFSPAEP